MNNAAAQKLYFRAVADQAKIPLIIYNWPQATGVDIPAEAVAQLSEHPNIIAIKESSGQSREGDADDPRSEGRASRCWWARRRRWLPRSPWGRWGRYWRSPMPLLTRPYRSGKRTVRENRKPRWIGRTASAVRRRWSPSKYGVPGLKYAMDLAGLLWRTAALAADSAISRGEERNRRSFCRFAGVIKRPHRLLVRRSSLDDPF